MIAWISFLFIAQVSLSLNIDTNKYYIDSKNLVQNPNFKNPICQYFCRYQSIPYWTTSSKIQLDNVTYICQILPGLNCSNNYTQGTDLDSLGINSPLFPEIRQTISIEQSGDYVVSVQWMPSVYNAIGKSFHITINNVRVIDVTINQTNNVFTYQKEQVVVALTRGTADCFIQMYGTTPDNLGIFVMGVYLNRIVPIQSVKEGQNMIEKVINNRLTLYANEIPGDRIFLRAFTDHMITFDRLRFYYFHRQNLTQYSTIMLSNINKLKIQQGQLVKYLVQQCQHEICNSINNVYYGLLEKLNHKENYNDAFILSRNPNGLGFFANTLDFFFYELPTLVLTYLLLIFLFKRLFNYRISKYLRKYSFYAIFMLIIYEGNVEEFSFFFFSQCKNLFSANISHKIANVLMIYFFFFTIVFSVGGLVFIYYHYKRLAKYFMEDSNEANMGAAIVESLERSVYPFIFGSVHALFLDSLGLQTIILACVETLYFLTRLYTLRTTIPQIKLKVTTMMVSSFIRLGFIFSFYMYERDKYPSIINSIHFDMVWIYIACWILEFLCDSTDLIIEVLLSIKKGCKPPQKAFKNNQKVNKTLYQKKQQKQEQKAKIFKILKIEAPAQSVEHQKQKIKDNCYSFVNPVNIFESQSTITNKSLTNGKFPQKKIRFQDDETTPEQAKIETKPPKSKGKKVQPVYQKKEIQKSKL